MKFCKSSLCATYLCKSSVCATCSRPCLQVSFTEFNRKRLSSRSRWLKRERYLIVQGYALTLEDFLGTILCQQCDLARKCAMHGILIGKEVLAMEEWDTWSGLALYTIFHQHHTDTMPAPCSTIELNRNNEDWDTWSVELQTAKQVGSLERAKKKTYIHLGFTKPDFLIFWLHLHESNDLLNLHTLKFIDIMSL